MIDFSFVSPTKIIFGRGAEGKLKETLLSFGYKRVLFVYGGGSIKKMGLYDKVVNQLNNGFEWFEASGVRPNPLIDFVREITLKAKEFKPDVILAVGGGSVIDSCKAIAASYYYDGDPFDFNLHKVSPKKSLPVGVILTFASAGAELSDSCVISDDKTGVKAGFNNDWNRPVFAIENPELTYSVPSYQKAAGISDIMMHSLERYFGASSSLQLADELALDVVKNTMEAGKRCLENPTDYEAHAALMLDSSLSHNGLTGIGKKTPFVVHPLEHALSGYKPDVTHGAGIALIYPAWANYVFEKDIHKFAHLTERLFGKVGANERETAIIGIRSMRDFFASLGMPTSFEEVGLTKEDVPNLVSLATGNGTRVIGLTPQPLEKKDVEAIFVSLLTKEALK
ncbi:MAG: iron-containing alcohol dehydrogenase [Bacilli bacterium]|nr:iron-containing alcohol dehydrogenase [Bacilli bacterium]